MASEILTAVKTRKNFYRNNYRHACNVLIVLLGIILVLIALNLYFYLSQPAVQFYATSFDGKLMELSPMNTPNYSSTPLI